MDAGCPQRQRWKRKSVRILTQHTGHRDTYLLSALPRRAMESKEEEGGTDWPWGGGAWGGEGRGGERRGREGKGGVLFCFKVGLPVDNGLSQSLITAQIQAKQLSRFLSPAGPSFLTYPANWYLCSHLIILPSRPDAQEDSSACLPCLPHPSQTSALKWSIPHLLMPTLPLPLVFPSSLLIQTPHNEGERPTAADTMW